MSEQNFKLLEHFHNPRNVGLIENADGYGRGKNPVNGYLTDFYIRVENGKINDIKFKTFGCVVTIASASGLSKVVKGKSLEEIVNYTDPIKTLGMLIKKELGEIPEKNWHCPPTAIKVLLEAILDYYKKNKYIKNVKKLEKKIYDIKCFFEKKLDSY